MKVISADGNIGYRKFQTFPSEIYKNNIFYRSTGDSIEKMLLSGKSAFHRHASVIPFLITNKTHTVARFALIQDKHLPDYVQLAFFEALPQQGDLWSLIKQKAKELFPNCSKVVVGLNGHLNYGAGFLLNRFNEVPLFGLPYSPNYYPAYFSELQERKMSSFRFRMDEYIKWAESSPETKEIDGLNIRFMRKKDIKSESRIYTYLNNQAFAKHPYWANREDDEDIELFYPFRFLLENENLIIAEIDNKPVGFFLWYPDFNELVKTQRDLNLWDVIRHKTGKKYSCFRFTEIGVLPEYQKTQVGTALLMKAIPILKKKGYTYCEGGFIFNENKSSIALASRMIQRSTGKKPEAYRVYAVYDGKL